MGGGKSEKEARRAQKREERLNRHVVTCPHCKGAVLDHMTQCPHCKGELVPAGYKPMDEKKRKILKTVMYAILIPVAVAVVLLVMILRRG